MHTNHHIRLINRSRHLSIFNFTNGNFESDVRESNILWTSEMSFLWGNREIQYHLSLTFHLWYHPKATVTTHTHSEERGILAHFILSFIHLRFLCLCCSSQCKMRSCPQTTNAHNTASLCRYLLMCQRAYRCQTHTHRGAARGQQALEFSCMDELTVFKKYMHRWRCVCVCSLKEGWRGAITISWSNLHRLKTLRSTSLSLRCSLQKLKEKNISIIRNSIIKKYCLQYGNIVVVWPVVCAFFHCIMSLHSCLPHQLFDIKYWFEMFY